MPQIQRRQRLARDASQTMQSDKKKPTYGDAGTRCMTKTTTTTMTTQSTRFALNHIIHTLLYVCNIPSVIAFTFMGARVSVCEKSTPSTRRISRSATVTDFTRAMRHHTFTPTARVACRWRQQYRHQYGPWLARGTMLARYH